MTGIGALRSSTKSSRPRRTIAAAMGVGECTASGSPGDLSLGPNRIARQTGMIRFSAAVSSGRFSVTIVMRALDKIDRAWGTGKPWIESMCRSGCSSPIRFSPQAAAAMSAAAREQAAQPI
jgi:hypothetical protein